LEHLEADVDITRNSTWEIIAENIKMSAKETLGYYELKKHKPWFNKGCSKLLDQRKQTKLQWLQDPSKVNGDNLNNVKLDLLADSRSTHRWKNSFSHLLNVNNVNNIRRIEIHATEPLVPGPSRLEVEIGIAKFKSINRQLVIKFWQN
jgi:hypothetical protein